MQHAFGLALTMLLLLNSKKRQHIKKCLGISRTALFADTHTSAYQHKSHLNYKATSKREWTTSFHFIKCLNVISLIPNTTPTVTTTKKYKSHWQIVGIYAGKTPLLVWLFVACILNVASVFFFIGESINDKLWAKKLNTIAAAHEAPK